jgi:membrane protein
MIMGVALLLFGAGGVVGQLQTSLNLIWGVEPKGGRGIIGFLKDRFVSYAMVLGVGFLLLVSLVISAALNAFDQFIESWIPGAGAVLRGVNFVVSLGLIAFLLASIFKFLPDARIGWKDVAVGALITAILFNVGKYLIGLYIGQSSTTSVYGAAGSLVTLLLWVYYSGLIFFFGAEVTQVYASRLGSGLAPADNAQPARPEAQRSKRMTEERRLAT